MITIIKAYDPHVETWYIIAQITLLWIVLLSDIPEKILLIILVLNWHTKGLNI